MRDPVESFGYRYSFSAPGRMLSHEHSQEDPDQWERNAAARDQRADERDTELDARGVATAAREASQAEREEQARQIPAGAAGRDQDADTRDLIAADRDEVASREAFVSERRTTTWRSTRDGPLPWTGSIPRTTAPRRRKTAPEGPRQGKPRLPNLSVRSSTGSNVPHPGISS
jgi:hypothetical protein